MELEEAGHEAAIDFARSELRRIFGSAVDRHLVKAHFTRWGHNALTRGSYASARPGAYRMRSVLRRPVGERVWFAGEACSVDEWATVAGRARKRAARRRAGRRRAGSLLTPRQDGQLWCSDVAQCRNRSQVPARLPFIAAIAAGGFP